MIQKIINKKMNFKKLLRLIFCFIFIFGTNSVFAQTAVTPPPGVEDQLSSSIAPSIPGPNTETNIFVESFSTDLNKAYITWYVDGIKKSAGAGITSFNFFTKGLGSKTTIKVEISGEDGRFLTKSFVFEPAEVSLVSEALTYTPPFYKGKAMYIPQATLKVVAFPEFVLPSGSKISPQNLVYTWKKDNKVLQSDSGFGKQSLYIEGSIIPRPISITVDVTAVGSNLKASRNIEISPEEPELLFYEDSLLYGPLWNKAIKNSLFLANSEIKLRAEPYFLSIFSPVDNTLSYSWQINGTSITGKGSTDNFLGLRNESGDDGSAQISLNIDSRGKILQSLRSDLFIDFTTSR